MISAEQLGERIVEARRAAGLTQAEVAERLGLSRPTMIATEKGKRQPSSAELVQLASILNTSVHELIRERHVSGGAAPRFRLSSNLATPELNDAVNRLESLGRDYALLENICGTARIPAPLESIRTYQGSPSEPFKSAALSGEQAAEFVRGILGCGSGPVADLEDRLEFAAGLRIFYIDLPSRIAGIFLWGEQISGCIAVNRAHPRDRQRWTVMHEVGHFLRDREAGDILPVSLPKKIDPSEAFAESFAKNVLMPSIGVGARFSERQRSGDGFTVADLVALSHDFGVSFQAMCLRLEELGLLRTGTYDRLAVKRFQPDNARKDMGLSASPRHSGLPRRYIQLALTAFAREEVSEGELAEFLRMDRIEARRIYQEWTNTSDELGEVQLMLAQKIVDGTSDGGEL